MTKTIYLTITESKNGVGDIWQENPTFDRDDAISSAVREWNHLTRMEQRKRHVYVGVYTVTVPDSDTRTAAQVYDEMNADDTFPYDCDVIELPKEDEPDA